MDMLERSVYVTGADRDSVEAILVDRRDVYRYVETADIYPGFDVVVDLEAADADEVSANLVTGFEERGWKAAGVDSLENGSAPYLTDAV